MGSDLASLADSSRMEHPAADATLPAVADKDTSSHGPTNDGTQRQSPVWKPIVMQAKHQTPCNYCHLPISPGNAIYPWVRLLIVKSVTQGSHEHSPLHTFREIIQATCI